MSEHFLTRAKAYAAFAGAIVTALLGTFTADSPVGKVLTVVAVLATAIVTYRVPNADEAPAPVHDDELGVSDLGLILAAVVVLLFVLLLTGRL